MKTRSFFFLFPCLLSAFVLSVAAQQQPIESAGIALAQFTKLYKTRHIQTDAERQLFAGEVADSTADSFGELLTNTPDNILLIDATRAVGRFQIFGANYRSADIYFYLKNEGAGWKIYAVRTFAVPKFIEQLYESLNARANLSTDEKRLFENLQLTLDTDKGLRAFFAENRASLDKLRSLLPSASKKATTPLFIRTDDKQFPAVAAFLRKMNFSLISIHKNGNVEIVIGGVTDNTVGFIYSPTGKPPEITTYEYIWVEPLGDNWYLYRTT